MCLLFKYMYKGCSYAASAGQIRLSIAGGQSASLLSSQTDITGLFQKLNKNQRTLTNPVPDYLLVPTRLLQDKCRKAARLRHPS